MLGSYLLQSSLVLRRATDVDLVVVNLDFEPRGEKCVESHNEVWVTAKQVGDTTYDSWRIDTGGRGGGGGGGGRKGEGRRGGVRGREGEGERGGR